MQTKERLPCKNSRCFFFVDYFVFQGSSVLRLGRYQVRRIWNRGLVIPVDK